ncbi:hypothetical protein B0H14DRAFT_3890112 [Mycena olivaceomarginata]|nr:hypothetical protein B0H14DRAFT_3890112 [Mycena olivaceomarginata]
MAADPEGHREAHTNGLHPDYLSFVLDWLGRFPDPPVQVIELWERQKADIERNSQTGKFDPNQARNFYVVFGFEVVNGEIPKKFPRTHVYEIERLLVVRNTAPDYSFFSTDRPLPPDIPALKFLPPPGTNDPNIFTPTYGARKITHYEANALPRYMQTRASIFGGCSGSPVFGLLEGGAVSSFVVGLVQGATHDYDIALPMRQVAPKVMRDLDTNNATQEGIRWAISRGAAVDYNLWTIANRHGATVRASFITGQCQRLSGSAESSFERVRTTYVLDAESKKVVANTAAVRGDAMRVEAIRWAISPTAYVGIETTFGQLDPPVPTTVVVSCTNGGNDYQLATILVPAVSDDAILDSSLIYQPH